MLSKKWVIILSYLGIFLYSSLFFFQEINLAASDLGRHLMNGQVIIDQLSVFNTNFYSYTQPDLPVINHHWFFGVMIHLIYSAFGFDAITLVSVFTHLLAIIILTLSVQRRTNKIVTLLALTLCLPLLTFRIEFRPESISYLLVIIYYTVLVQALRTTLTKKNMLVLALLQLLWVNTHIFFIFYLPVLGAFGLQLLINRTDQRALPNFKKLIFLGVILTLVSICNPQGLTGLIEPFLILREYGYRVAENQGLLFMSKYSFQPLYAYMFLLISGSLIFVLSSLKSSPFIKQHFAEVLLALFFIAAGLKMIRVLSFTGIFLLPLLAALFFHKNETLKKYYQKVTNTSVALLCTSTVSILVVLLGIATRIFLPQPAFGLGILSDNQDSAQFFKESNVKGPIFNNYDIGGYLIFNFYPQEKVFVDNRPEAYTVSFLQDTYIKMQEDEQVWQAASNKYKFNLIYFYRHDLTPWAQQFLIKRTADPTWVPIYVDAHTIILIKNIPENQTIIDEYELPREMFGIKNY